MLDRRAVLGSGAMGLCALTSRPPARADATRPVAAPARALIDAAMTQVGVTTHYDPTYVRLEFPGGDVPIERGVCTDVIVRAYRRAFAFDLQAALNVDMRRSFSAYPRRWGLSAPDPNIDHRRVPNLQMFFARQGAALPFGTTRPIDHRIWHPGDIATQMIGGRLPHIGIVSDRRSPTGNPLLIHNIGRGTQVEDILELYPVTGHYRYFPAA